MPLPFAGGSWVVWERRDEPSTALDEELPIHRVAAAVMPLPAALQRVGGRWAGGWSAPAAPCCRWPASTPWTAFNSAGTSLVSGHPAPAGRDTGRDRGRRGDPAGRRGRDDRGPGFAAGQGRGRPGGADRRTHCQQVLGGIGFTAEHALHRHIKRSLVLDGLLGSARELTREAGARLREEGSAPRLVHL